MVCRRNQPAAVRIVNEFLLYLETSNAAVLFSQMTGYYFRVHPGSGGIVDSVSQAYGKVAVPEQVGLMLDGGLNIFRHSHFAREPLLRNAMTFFR